MNVLKNQRGVTLIELLAVIVILGIIAAIAVPAVMSNFDSAKKNSDAQTEAIVKEAVQRFLLDVASKGDISSFDFAITDNLASIQYPETGTATVKLSDYLQLDSSGKIKTAKNSSTFKVTIDDGKATISK